MANKRIYFPPFFVILHQSKGIDRRVRDFEEIKQDHIKRGYIDIGYTFFAEQVGDDFKFIQGRRIGEEGAHALGFNFNSIGICMHGDYDNEIMPIKRLIKLLVFIKSLQCVYNIPNKRVLGHWETYLLRNKPIKKTCPGTNINMKEIREALEIL